MSDIAHDKQGFLVGEMVDLQQQTVSFQAAALPLWRGIDRNVAAIARAVGVNARAQRSQAGASTAAAARALTPSRGPRTVSPAGRGATSTPGASGRGAQGRVVAPTPRDAGGRFTATRGAGVPGGSRDAAAGGAALAERIGGLTRAIAGIGGRASNADPALAAAQEVKDAVAPVGRGILALYGRAGERKKERWYQRILDAIKGRRPEGAGAGAAGPADGGALGALAGGILGRAATMLPAVLAGAGGLLVAGLAALAGTALGKAIYDWLDKSGIAGKIFDAFDAARDWILKKVDEAKAMVEEFDSARQLARTGIGGGAPVLDASGRNSNDPRRLDIPGNSVPAVAGRIVGSVQRGADYMAGEGGVPSSEKPRIGNPFKRVLRAGPGFTDVERADGSMERQQGARNWRNNNPGNIEFGEFARRMGAIGSDGRFAVFPDYETGRKAKEALIFEGKGYASKTLREAIARYAPPSENDTGAYQRAVLQAVGGHDKRMSDYTTAERGAIMNAMQRFEGFKTGASLPLVSSSVAAAGIPRPAQVGIPAAVPARIPSAPEVGIPTPLNTQSSAERPVVVVLREPIGQDVGDRNIANLVTGMPGK